MVIGNPPGPSLSVRAFAEMIDKPAYEQLDILEGQKYPNRAPASFRVPYYRRALATIRDFYRTGRNALTLTQAIENIEQSSMTPSMQRNNIRVLNAFQRSTQPRRQLTVQSFGTLRADFHGVILKYTPDLVALDSQKNAHILYNCRQVAIEPDVAKRTLELIQWILSTNNVNLTNIGLEYVDLVFRKRIHTIQRIRSQTLGRAQRSARVIVQLWQGI